MPYEIVRLLNSDHPYRYDGTLFGGTKLWTPSEISTALWLDADSPSSITLNGSTVSQWNDKSGNGRNATQGTAASQPTYKASDAVLGGKPSIGAPATTGFVGLVTPSFAARTWFFMTAYGDGTPTTFPATYPTLLSGAAALGAERGGMGNISSNTWFSSVVWAPYPFTNGAQTTNTTALPMPASVLVFEGTTTVTQTWGIGFNQVTTDRSWAGPLGEIIATSGVTPLPDRQKIEGYLAWKWRTQASLPLNHPYKYAPPTA